MEEKSTKLKYRRNKKSGSSRVEALTQAQKIAFAPFSFQVVAALLEFGILSRLEKSPATKREIISDCNVDRYTVDALFDAALCIGLIEKEENTFRCTKLAEAFLFDEMTRVNFNFVKDICYLGASELVTSFKENRPAGLQKYYFGKASTIYPMLPQLSEQMKKSWYEFDHHYSDDCFLEILPIIYKSTFSGTDKKKNIYDIGGNTGKFERACLSYDKDCVVTMFDLPENIEVAKKTFDTDRCKFVSIDVISEQEFPKISGAVLMSQFLDCFSREHILFILNKLSKAIDEKTRVFILEPFIDKQVFEGAAYALSHISLYFTCMANGKSKMYNESDFEEIIKDSNLEIVQRHENIGKYDYTLLECRKK